MFAWRRSFYDAQRSVRFIVLQKTLCLEALSSFFFCWPSRLPANHRNMQRSCGSFFRGFRASIVVGRGRWGGVSCQFLRCTEIDPIIEQLSNKIASKVVGGELKNARGFHAFEQYGIDALFCKPLQAKGIPSHSQQGVTVVAPNKRKVFFSPLFPAFVSWVHVFPRYGQVNLVHVSSCGSLIYT